MTTQTDSRLRESALLEQLNLSQKGLRALRRECLKEGEHYGRDAAGFWYSPEAKALLRRQVGKDSIDLPLQDGSTAPTPEPAAPKAPERSREDLRITRVWPERSRMVLCQRGNGLEVVCQVQDSRNMRPGMVLKDAFLGQYSVWYYNGPLPRRRRDPAFFPQPN